MKTCCLIFLLLLCSSIQAQIITTIAGNGIPGFSGEGGPAINAEFYSPSGITADKFGNYYVADAINNVVQKINTAGIITRFAGNSGSGFSGDGGQATAAQLQLPLGTIGLIADTIGNIYITDGPRIRMVNTSGIITTIAGSGVYGFSGDGGPALSADFKSPNGLYFDKLGRLYICDPQNYDIRMVDNLGNIATVAGITSPGFSGDGGPATDAQLVAPFGIAIDDSLNLYTNDEGDGRIRKVNKFGTISTFAGIDDHDIAPASCEGCPATTIKLPAPSGVTVDGSGNVFVADEVNQLIYRVNTAGLIYTVAGTGTSGFYGDEGPASLALLNAPTTLCMDNTGNLLLIDKSNDRIRKIWFSTVGVPIQNATSSQLSIYPNPIIHNEFTCSLTTTANEAAKMLITNVLGQEVFTTSFFTNSATNISLNVPPGFYFVTAYTAAYKMQAKLVVE